MKNSSQNKNNWRISLCAILAALSLVAASCTNTTTATTTTGSALPALSPARIHRRLTRWSVPGESRPVPGRKAEYPHGAGRLVAARRTSSRAFYGRCHMKRHGGLFARVVGFDNERGKGDRCHIDGLEVAYNFKDVDPLIEDFIAAVAARREP